MITELPNGAKLFSPFEYVRFTDKALIELKGQVDVRDKVFVIKSMKDFASGDNWLVTVYNFNGHIVNERDYWSGHFRSLKWFERLLFNVKQLI